MSTINSDIAPETVAPTTVDTSDGNTSNGNESVLVEGQEIEMVTLFGIL